jgi:hypothetical protein
MSTSSYKSKFAFLALAVGILLVGGPTIASARPITAYGKTRPEQSPAVFLNGGKKDFQPSPARASEAARYDARARRSRANSEPMPSDAVKRGASAYYGPCGSGMHLGKDGNCYIN